MKSTGQVRSRLFIQRTWIILILHIKWSSLANDDFIDSVLSASGLINTNPCHSLTHWLIEWYTYANVIDITRKFSHLCLYKLCNHSAILSPIFAYVIWIEEIVVKWPFTWICWYHWFAWQSRKHLCLLINFVCLPFHLSGAEQKKSTSSMPIGGGGRYVHLEVTHLKRACWTALDSSTGYVESHQCTKAIGEKWSICISAFSYRLLTNGEKRSAFVGSDFPNWVKLILDWPRLHGLLQWHRPACQSWQDSHQICLFSAALDTWSDSHPNVSCLRWSESARTISRKSCTLCTFPFTHFLSFPPLPLEC